MRFTEEQQKVINTRQRNLLVSAAAGSGKTAVLVQRIIEMITDQKTPTPVSDFLVVTFTNAAAAEMRERIGNALYKAIEEAPENLYLQQQLTMLPSAHIMTLHAFCLKVIRNYFYEIDLDPGFSIGDEADLTLMRREVMEDVIESFYGEGDKAFLELADGYASGKTDKVLEELIMTIYKMSQSHPTPEMWLKKSVEQLRFESLSDWFESSYVQFIVEEVTLATAHLTNFIEDIKILIEGEPGLMPMLETINTYGEVIEAIDSRLSTPKELFEALQTIELPRAKSAKRGTDKSLVEPVKHLRDQVKKGINSIVEKFGTSYDETFIDQMSLSYKHMKTLSNLVLKYSESFSAKKMSKNMLDFNDIEHFALRLLLNEDGSSSEVAKVYKNQFKEILADEYQDTNLVQETILQSVSTIDQGQPNIFMVGDIKQSIYKFRLAKPELFADKYDHYSFDDSPYQKIELHKNFRSRREVIEMTNYLFSQLMSKSVGDVTYDHHAELNQGASYEIDEGPYGSEVVLIDKGSSKRATPEIEAHQIAIEIEALMHQQPPMMVFDQAQGITRQLMYKDIVILLRTMSGWSESFVSTLKDHSIPVFSHTSTGYFDTIEIQTSLNTLRIIDNPKQDIPLIAVLRSPMFKFTGDELVTLRLCEKDVDFHSAMMLYHQSILGDTPLDRKVLQFVEGLEKWRSMKNECSIYEMVNMIFEDTGYYDYMGLTIGGVQRQSNLDMFLGMVFKYEQSSHKGLFNFTQYMENVKRQSVDYGQAHLEQDSVNQVTIMSIHGSKGLEFPVVIVGGLGKAFNKMDLRQSVLLHQDYGFGTDRVLVDQRQRIASPTKEVIKGVMERELLSEELRILYVALTRAREKLIFVATVKNLPNEVEKWAQKVGRKEVALDVVTVQSASRYIDWVMMALLRHQTCKDLLMHTELDVPSFFELSDKAPAVSVREVIVDEISLTTDVKERLTDVGEVKSQIDQEAFEATMAWTYDHAALAQLNLSQSVSELKRLAAEEVEMIGPKSEAPEYRPVFITGEQPLTGAEKGTIFHKVMDHLDFSLSIEDQNPSALVQRLVEAQVITSKEKATVFVQGISNFLESPLGKRVHLAAVKGVTFKEQPFVMGIPVNEVATSEADDFIMIQGVIDLHFEEGDDLVIVDYKTDYAKDLHDDVFEERYESQMTYYRRALEQQTGKSVKEVWLYIVGANRYVQVNTKT